MAAARGVIDFSRARPLDPAWRRRRDALLDAVGRELDLEVLRANHAHNLALVGNPSLTEDSWKRVQGAAMACAQAVQATLRPWEPPPEERRAAEARDLRDAYVRLVGDPSSPEVREREARVLETIRDAKRGHREADTRAREFERRMKERGAGHGR